MSYLFQFLVYSSVFVGLVISLINYTQTLSCRDYHIERELFSVIQKDIDKNFQSTKYAQFINGCLNKSRNSLVLELSGKVIHE